MPIRKSYVFERGSSFVYRRDIPESFRPVLGKSAWWIVLKAETRAKAEALAKVHSQAHDDILARLKAHGPVPAIRQQIATIEANSRQVLDTMTQAFFVVPRKAEEVEALDQRRGEANRRTERKASALTADMLAAAERSLDGLPPVERARIEAEGGVRDAFASYQESRTDTAILTAAQDMQVDNDDLDLPEDELVRRLGEAELRRRRLAATVIETNRLQVALAPIGLADAPGFEPTTTPDGPTINTVFGEWLKSRKQQPETERKWRVYVRRFVDVHGDVPIRTVTKAMVRDYVDTIADLPDSRGLRPELRKGSVKDLLAWKDGEDEVELVTAATVTKHLDCIRAFFRWAARRDHMESNPAQDIDPPHDNRPSSEDVRPFTVDELTRITSAAAQKWGRGDDRYWVMLAAIYTGARREELCQLARSNLEQHGKRWFIRVDDHDGRQIKNDTSIRSIPLHPDLIAAGFLDHIQMKPTSPLLFASMTKTAGRYGHKLGAAFHRLLREHLEMRDRAVRWHSFRHSFADAARAADLPEDIRHRLMGHAGANKIADGYGKGHSLDKLADWMERVQPFAEPATSTQPDTSTTTAP